LRWAWTCAKAKDKMDSGKGNWPLIVCHVAEKCVADTFLFYHMFGPSIGSFCAEYL